ncbi:MAG: metallophosphoesterase [Phycisphaerae bacterium]|nr:metallophosphoesterase [Phycisphaerae bacterium]
MLIGVIADTHDRLPTMDAAMEVFRRAGVDAVIHAGDIVAPFAADRLVRFAGPTHVVYGNNDGERDGLKKKLPKIQDGPLKLELGGRKILVHHFIDWCSEQDVAAAEIVITGHTHEVVNREQDGRLMLNPGECCGWVHGRCTVAILNTEGPSAEIIELPG